MPSLVSVVVPAYNASRTIAGTIESVIAQTYRPIEIVVVDDGSTDATADVVRAFGDAVRYLRQDNAGDLVARNAGVRASQGAYVAFVDADDLWRPEKVAAQVALLESEPGLGAAQCGALFVDDALHPLEERRCAPGRASLVDVLRFRGLPALSSAVLARRSCLEQIGPLDVTVRGKDEWDLAIKLAWRCGLGNVPDALVVRRVHGASASRAASYAARQIGPGLEILRRTFADPTLPADARRARGAAYGAFFAMIAGSYLEARRPDRAAIWALRAIAAHPPAIRHVLGLPLRRLRRARGRTAA